MSDRVEEDEERLWKQNGGRLTVELLRNVYGGSSLICSSRRNRREKGRSESHWSSEAAEEEWEDRVLMTATPPLVLREREREREEMGPGVGKSKQ